MLYLPADFCIHPLRNPLHRRHGYIHPLRTFLQRNILQSKLKECVFILGEVADGLQIVRFGLGKVPYLQSITPCPVEHHDLLTAIKGVIIKAIDSTHNMAVNG